jgi:hypothetical protein
MEGLGTATGRAPAARVKAAHAALRDARSIGIILIEYTSYYIVFITYSGEELSFPLALTALVHAMWLPSQDLFGVRVTGPRTCLDGRARRSLSRVQCSQRTQTSDDPLGRFAGSNFRMAESKISIRTMHAHNKIALSLCAGDAILQINHADDGISPIQII